jgi:glycosyltransferase involved in cell wall biosynthesis
VNNSEHNIAICVPIYNGEGYVLEQLKSIEKAMLSFDDKTWCMYLSDDGSSDQSLDIISQFASNKDNIHIFNGPAQGVVKNIEFLLNATKEEYIFLSDQDDIWLPNRVTSCFKLLYDFDFDLVLSNGYVCTNDLEKTNSLIWDITKPNQSFYRNFIKNTYTGACMAFNRKILNSVLPLPSKYVMHDHWIALIALSKYKIYLDSDPLILYRRHENNVTNFGVQTKFQFRKVRDRLYLLFRIINFFLARHD